MRVLARLVEGLLWAGGSLMLVFFLGHLGVAELQRRNDIESFRSAQHRALQLTSLADEQLQPDLEESPSPAVDHDPIEPDQSLWSAGRIASFAASFSQGTSKVLGVFEIPRLDLEVPLYDGASDLHMDLGVARIEGTALPGESGNMGLAGHRDGYFRVLKDITFGDEMIVNSGTALRRYRVEQLMIVEPNAVDVLDDTDDTSITLVTCYPFYFVGHAPQRFIVRAVLQEETLLKGG